MFIIFSKGKMES